ncbi:MAG: hypothetical protein ACRDHX_10075, partial [Chloroflexota bacterium]
GIVDVHVFTLPTDTGVYREELVQQSVEVLRAHNGQDVDEGQLGSWLDLQYTDDILGTIRADYERALKLTHAMLNALAPFQSDPDLRDEFFEMFDSVEVLPTSLVEGYQANLNNEEIIEANSLLVGIQWYQWQQLRRKGLAVEPKGDLPRLANVPYSEELGLQL